MLLLWHLGQQFSVWRRRSVKRGYNSKHKHCSGAHVTPSRKTREELPVGLGLGDARCAGFQKVLAAFREM